MTKKHDDILKAARERMSEAQEGDRDNRLEMKSDLKFITGDHWEESVKEGREAEGRPCLTINRLPQFVRGVTGDIRRMNPAINIIPGDGDSSQEVAEVYEGLIRQIEYSNDASSIYELAATDAAQCGIGHWRVLSEYEGDEGFDQVLKVKRIHNVFSVLWDPASREPTREDAEYCFVTEFMREKAFEKAYPDAAKISADMDESLDGREHWMEGTGVIVAEYFWKEPVTKTIGLTADGQTIENPKPPMDFIKSRKVHTHKVMWAKVSGKAILEGPQEFPCSQIPVISVVGEEIDRGDKVVRSSVIRYAKDPAQLYNYWSSADAELVALQPKAPYILTTKQVEGQESYWTNANSSNDPYLLYNPDEKAPPPQRSQPPVSSAGMAQQAMKAVEDMKATTGIYDAGLGNRSNEQSGVAIRQRQMESDVANSIYSDNLAKSIARCGRILVDMIPKIYDTDRAIRILGKDDAEKIVHINQQIYQPGVGVATINPVTLGKYEVRVSVGPNYSTRRQETAESMMAFVKSFPQSASIVGDLIADAMDWPNKDRFVDRLKKSLPPQMRDPDDLSPEEQQQAQMGMMQQQQAMQKQEQADMAELKKQVAEAAEAEADAEKAALEVEEKELELAAQSGELNVMISQLVQREVERALQGAFQPGLGPQL